MSGGFVNESGLKEGAHQVVIFTFKGPIDQAKCQEWNIALADLKQTFGEQMMGVTIDGLPTPVNFTRRRPSAATKAVKKTAKKRAKKRRP
jgi:hypothetical protein